MFVHSFRMHGEAYAMYNWAIQITDHYKDEVSCWSRNNNVTTWLDATYEQEDFNYKWSNKNGTDCLIVMFVSKMDLDLFMRKFGLLKQRK